MSKMLESKQWEHNCRGKAINASSHLGHVDCVGCCMCSVCVCLSVYVCAHLCSSCKSKVSEGEYVL